MCAVLGVQLIEPFFAKTIQKDSTHSSLKVFYQGLYDKMADPVEQRMFKLEEPYFPGVSVNLFCGVLKSYGWDVIESVVETVEEYQADAIKLCNFILPELREVLGRQRRDYGLDPELYPL